MLRGTSLIRKPLAWAIVLGVSLALAGCGGESTPTPTSTEAQPDVKAAPADPKSVTKGGKQKKFQEEEPTALEKRAARLKAAKGK